MFHFSEKMAFLYSHEHVKMVSAKTILTQIAEDDASDEILDKTVFVIRWTGINALIIQDAAIKHHFATCQRVDLYIESEVCSQNHEKSVIFRHFCHIFTFWQPQKPTWWSICGRNLFKSQKILCFSNLDCSWHWLMGNLWTGGPFLSAMMP